MRCVLPNITYESLKYYIFTWHSADVERCVWRYVDQGEFKLIKTCKGIYCSGNKGVNKIMGAWGNPESDEWTPYVRL